MNRNYAGAAAKLPHQELGVKMCELASMDMERVQAVDIHCDATTYPVVTFTGYIRNPGVAAAVACIDPVDVTPICANSATFSSYPVKEQTMRFELRPITDDRNDTDE